MQLVVLVQLTDVPATVPNLAVVWLTTKPVPVMVTTVAPPGAPELGLRALMTGTGW